MKSIHTEGRCYGEVEKGTEEIHGEHFVYCRKCRKMAHSSEWMQLVPVAALCHFKGLIVVTAENKEIIRSFMAYHQINGR